MEIKISSSTLKTIIAPVLILLVAVVGSVLVFNSGEEPPTDSQLVEQAQNLRALELSIPGMFCAGCSASVEANISPLAGVERVEARLAPTKSATIVYDSDIIKSEEIINNEIFSVFGGATVVSDEEFTGSVLPATSDDGLAIPQDIQDLSLQVVALLQDKESQGKDVSPAKGLFNQVNSDITRGSFENARSMLNSIVSILSAL